MIKGIVCPLNVVINIIQWLVNPSENSPFDFKKNIKIVKRKYWKQRNLACNKFNELVFLYFRTSSFHHLGPSYLYSFFIVNPASISLLRHEKVDHGINEKWKWKLFTVTHSITPAWYHEGWLSTTYSSSTGGTLHK